MAWPEQKTNFPWARASSAIKRTLGFVSVRVLKRTRTNVIWSCMRFLMGIGSCDYKGLQVYDMLLLQESWWSGTQFRIPENKLQCSMSAGRRTCRFQLKKRGRIHLLLPFILFVPQCVGCYWSTLVRHFCLLTWLIQILISSKYAHRHIQKYFPPIIKQSFIPVRLTY